MSFNNGVISERDKKYSAICLVRFLMWAEVEATDVLNQPVVAANMRRSIDELVAQFAISTAELHGLSAIHSH